MKKSDPPKHLSAAAAELWSQLQDDYDLGDAASRALLLQLCSAYDRAEAARRKLRKDGMFTADRFGQTRPHPAIAIEHAARAQVLAAMRALRLEIDP